MMAVQQLCKRLSIIGLVALSFFSCKQKKEQPQEDKIAQCLELKSVDRAFSEHSKKEGMKAAYMEYLDSNGVVLRANQMPIVGANAIDYLIQQNDADYILTWDPQQADIAESGELGFTYGIYLMRSKSVDTSIYGTYTNIWKRQSDGQWKLYLNTYNEGVGN